MLSSAILLGPQRHVPIVRAAVESLVPDARSAPIAVVTAGWEEREAEDQELRDHVQRPVQNLGIWSRVEQIFAHDRELLSALRQRHDDLRRAQELYRLRLSGLLGSLRELLRRPAGDPLLPPEQHGALRMVRELDREHEERVAGIHAAFEARWRPGERAAVQREKRALKRLIEDAPCLLIAGGHIAVLLHRLRLFDVLGMHGDRPVIAWSAGAMALCERIVLFHDAPPQGSADAEVMEAGFGLVPDLVALPHGSRRLQTNDERNVQLLARRFAPSLCALLDPGSRLDWDGRRWQAQPGTRRLAESGALHEVGA
jgi:hypothetical protein